MIYKQRTGSELFQRSHHITSHQHRMETYLPSKTFKDLNDLWETTVQNLTSQKQQLAKFKDEYDEMHQLLDELPQKLKHSVMVCFLRDDIIVYRNLLNDTEQVPFSSIAFFPGEIVHSNEFTVMIGDNYFVKRTGKQTQGIVQRRNDCGHHLTCSL